MLVVTCRSADLVTLARNVEVIAEGVARYIYGISDLVS